MVALAMKGFALVVVLGVSSASWAQSFNIDMEAFFSPPLGGGVPSDSFGGAAGTPGRWNSVPAAGFGTNLLVDLQGNPTGVRMIGPMGGGSAGHNIPINTGDYARLLNDARAIDRDLGLSFQVSGLTPGRYEVFTYVVSISNVSQVRQSKVSILGAIGVSDKVAIGPMPGNRLIEGVTHTKHEVLITNGEINLHIDYLETTGNGWFNGIQVKQVVPEPATILGATIGFLSLLRQRRQRRVSS